jgi:hypothetical protein
MSASSGTNFTAPSQSPAPQALPKEAANISSPMAEVRPVGRPQKFLPVKEICEILKVAQNTNVTSLKFGDLEISFNRIAEAPAKIHQTDLSPASENSLKEVTRDLLEEAEDAQLLLDDPAAFEQRMIDSHFQRGRDGQAQHRRVESAI